MRSGRRARCPKPSIAPLSPRAEVMGWVAKAAENRRLSSRGSPMLGMPGDRRPDASEGHRSLPSPRRANHRRRRKMTVFRGRKTIGIRKAPTRVGARALPLIEADDILAAEGGSKAGCRKRWSRPSKGPPPALAAGSSLRDWAFGVRRLGFDPPERDSPDPTIRIRPSRAGREADGGCALHLAGLVEAATAFSSASRSGKPGNRRKSNRRGTGSPAARIALSGIDRRGSPDKALPDHSSLDRRPRSPPIVSGGEG